MNKRSTEILVGLFVVLGALGLLFLALKAANLTSFGQADTYTVTARFAERDGAMVQILPDGDPRDAVPAPERIDLTGTFMPAYGLNRLFGELPVIGAILGNGRDRGLLGITFKLTGETSKPNLVINPLSIIAPGVFRQIFEFR